MDSWNCCRACLGVDALHPIFQLIDHHEKYTDVIYSATGLKVEYNDALPQKMCTSCINFINASYKFRKKCEENQKSLISRLNDKPQYEIKIETNIFDIENNGNVSIDISDLINYIDVHVEAVASYTYMDGIESNDIEFETKVEDMVDKPVELIFKSKKSKNCKEKPVKRSLRKKKENGEKKERAKHGYEKTDKCSFCDYKASNAEQVKCDQCPARFKSVTLMRIHKNRHRAATHAFRCGVCDNT
ncbi:hypothetical protein B5X24_HaOG213915, partial [Helicoverpa armigera]